MMSDAKPNLILIGLRACGKSTIGRVLAQRLDRAFVDLDEVTSGLLGASGAGEAIEEHGIEGFREAEGRALGSVLETTNQVVALGGRTPTADGCGEMLASDACRVIYLRALPGTLRERLRHADNTDRPALVGNDVVDEVETLFEQRDGLYREIAETVIHVDGVAEESVVAAALAVVKAGI
jgi:shikimate kinase